MPFFLHKCGQKGPSKLKKGNSFSANRQGPMANLLTRDEPPGALRSTSLSFRSYSRAGTLEFPKNLKPPVDHHDN